MRFTSEDMVETFQKEEFVVSGIDHYVCDSCGETELDVAAMRECAERIKKEYREAHGLLAPEQIRSIRASLSLSQKQFESALGVSSPTVSRWETGSIVQSKIADNLIRGMSEHRCLAEDLMARAEVKRELSMPIRACGSWSISPQKRSIAYEPFRY